MSDWLRRSLARAVHLLGLFGELLAMPASLVIAEVAERKRDHNAILALGGTEDLAWAAVNMGVADHVIDALSLGIEPDEVYHRLRLLRGLRRLPPEDLRALFK